MKRPFTSTWNKVFFPWPSPESEAAMIDHPSEFWRPHCSISRGVPVFQPQEEGRGSLVSGWLPTRLRTKDALPPSRTSLMCPFRNPSTSRPASLLRARGPGAVVSAPNSRGFSPDRLSCLCVARVSSPQSLWGLLPRPLPAFSGGSCF